MITQISCALIQPFMIPYLSFSFGWSTIGCATFLADMNAAVSSARRVTSSTYYKLSGLRIGEMIRLSSFLLSGTCLFCNTVLWVGDSNRTCRSNSIPQHCWSAFYWFFICSDREFSVRFRNVGAKGCSGGVLIRNALFSLKYRELFLLLWGLALPYSQSRIFSVQKKSSLCSRQSQSNKGL